MAGQLWKMMLKPQAPSWIEQLDWLLAAFLASRIVIPALDLEELELLSALMPVAEVLFHVSAVAVFRNCPMLDDDDADCDAMLCMMDQCPLCLLQLRTIFLHIFGNIVLAFHSSHGTINRAILHSSEVEPWLQSVTVPEKERVGLVNGVLEVCGGSTEAPVLN